jgi:hypothetical protein
MTFKMLNLAALELEEEDLSMHEPSKGYKVYKTPTCGKGDPRSMCM